MGSGMDVALPAMVVSAKGLIPSESGAEKGDSKQLLVQIACSKDEDVGPRVLQAPQQPKASQQCK